MEFGSWRNRLRRGQATDASPEAGRGKTRLPRYEERMREGRQAVIDGKSALLKLPEPDGDSHGGGVGGEQSIVDSLPDMGNIPPDTSDAWDRFGRIVPNLHETLGRMQESSDNGGGIVSVINREQLDTYLEQGGSKPVVLIDLASPQFAA